MSNGNPERTSSKKGIKTADIISIISVFVSSVLAWFTFGLYRTAANDSKTAGISASSAKMSAIIAQNTLDETRKYDSISLIKQQRAIDDNNTTSQLVFDRANKSLTLQDSSLKETQKEFYIENKPFIQLSEISVEDVPGTSSYLIKFNIQNFGKEPAQLISFKYKALGDDNKDPVRVDFSNMALVDGASGQYIPMQSWYRANQNTGYTPSGIFTAIKTGKGCIYIVGEVEYINTISEAKYLFKFIYKISPYPSMDIKTIIDTMYEMRKKTK